MKYIILFAASWIFLPSTYSNTPPVRPRVEALPAPQWHGYSRSQSMQWDRNGGYIHVRSSRW